MDVAIALISPEAEQMFASFAVSTDVVAATTDTGFSEQNPMIVCGYPANYRRTLAKGPGAALHEFACARYATLVASGLDASGRYRARWKEAKLTSDDAVFPPVPKGETFDIVHPVGMSGGPLWRFRSVGEGNLWSPARMGQIVGVASTYLDDVEFCVSVAAWGDWFSETIAKIDTEI